MLYFKKNVKIKLTMQLKGQLHQCTEKEKRGWDGVRGMSLPGDSLNTSEGNVTGTTLSLI